MLRFSIFKRVGCLVKMLCHLICVDIELRWTSLQVNKEKRLNEPITKHNSHCDHVKEVKVSKCAYSCLIKPSLAVTTAVAISDFCRMESQKLISQ